MGTVKYRNIAGFDGFRVGSDGGIWSRRCGKWTRLSTYRRPYGVGYVVICLRPERGSGSRVSCKYVHRLVLEAFVGPCPRGMRACHQDGDPTNNRLSNLRWDTQKANMADADRHGHVYRGEATSRAKLSADQVRAIREEVAAGRTHHSVAEEYGVCRQTVTDIVLRRRWRHIT